MKGCVLVEGAGCGREAGPGETRDPMTARLELEGITKRFGRILANDGVSIALEAGQVHALLGENGAGKSTLMQVAYGIHRPDAGSIRIDGKVRTIRSASDAIRFGMGMVHQHFTLVPTLLVVENILLGQTPRRMLNLRTPAQRVAELGETYGLRVNPWARVEDLSVGALQRVEILKLLYRDPQIIILDEPTSLLTPGETAHLFRVMRQWAAEGRSVVFITHKLKEVFAVSHTITVLRKGRVAGSLPSLEADEQTLARLMVGEDWSRSAPAIPSLPSNGQARQAVMVARDLVVLDDNRDVRVDHVSLDLFPGEIVGVAGVEGNGQRELAEALAGVRPPEQGAIIALGSPLTGMGASQFAALGIGLIPEDRRGAGLALNLTVLENLVLRPVDRRRFVRWGLLSRQRVLRHAWELVREFGIAATPSSLVMHLSGGNQQKIVLARGLSWNPRILIAAQPTQGLDVGATDHVHTKIVEHRSRGCAILFISSNLDEVMELSDRIFVMYEGRLVEVPPAGKTSRERIGLLMAGASTERRLASLEDG